MADRTGSDISAAAGLVADPSRAGMLTALLDGRALTATELSLEADVTPQTASSHLSRLLSGGLVAMTSQGRHRYFRLATADVARMLETLMGLAPREGTRIRTGPREAPLRRARVCYDHLAGEAAVELLARLRGCRFIEGADERMRLTRAGEAWIERLGIDLARLRARRRPLCRSCLDWSERRSHLAGAVGAALLDRLLSLRFARREAFSRAVLFSAEGERFLKSPEAFSGRASARTTGVPAGAARAR